MHTARGF